MPTRVSTSSRSACVHGSAPKMPIFSDDSAGSIPCRTISSIRFSMYDGVTRMIFGSKSRISCTCFSVCPPDIGTTMQPSRSAP